MSLFVGLAMVLLVALDGALGERLRRVRRGVTGRLGFMDQDAKIWNFLGLSAPPCALIRFST